MSEVDSANIDLEATRLVPQMYGIATAQGVFGGPRGIWLECRACNRSDKIEGSRFGEKWESASDADCAKVFRHHGWTGNGDRMTDARCPDCSKMEAPAVDTLTVRFVDGARFEARERGGGMTPAWTDETGRIELIRAYRGTTYMARVDGVDCGSWRDFEGAARVALAKIAGGAK